MNLLINWLNESGGGLIMWIVGMNLWTAALLIVVLALDVTLQRRIAPALRIALYSVIALRLLLPLDYTSPIGLFPGGGDQADSLALPQIALIEETLANRAPDDGPIATGPISSIETGPVGVVSMTGILVIAYATVAAALLTIWLVASVNLARIVARSGDVPAAIRSLSPPCRIVRTPDVGPALVGLWRPVIALPHSVVEAYEGGRISRAQLRYMIDHERAHLHRRDHWQAAACQLIVISFWPIAAVWIAAWRVRQLMELACDEQAVRGFDVRARREYGETLLLLAGGFSVRRHPAALANVGMLGQAQTALRSRLRAIARHSRAWPTSLQIVLVALTLPVIVACAATRREAQPSKSSASASQAAGEQIDLTVRVFESWPEHPKLKWDLRQSAGNAPIPDSPPDAPDAHRMNPAELELFLDVVAQGDGRIMIQPRLRTISGQSATVLVDQNGADDRAEVGLIIQTVPVINDDGTLSIELNYKEVGVEVKPPAANYEGGDEIEGSWDINLQPGETEFVLATGMIGAPMRLVAITAEIVGDDGAAPPAMGQLDDDASARNNDVPQWLRDMPFPQMQYMTTVWDLNERPRLERVMRDEWRLASEARWDGAEPASDFAALYAVPAASMREIADWFDRHRTRDHLGGKNGAAIEPPGTWAVIQRPDRPAQPDSPAIIGFDIELRGDAEKDDSGRLPLAVLYRTHAPAGQADVEALARFAATRVPRDHSLCALIPATNTTPWRLLIIRMDVLERAEDWPFQRAAAAGASIDIPPGVDPEQFIRDHIEQRLTPPPPPDLPPQSQRADDQDD